MNNIAVRNTELRKRGKLIARKKRVRYVGATYHVMSRGNRKEAVWSMLGIIAEQEVLQLI